MHQRIPGFGVAFATSVTLVLSGCGAAGVMKAAEAPPAPSEGVATALAAPPPPADMATPPASPEGGEMKKAAPGIPGTPMATNSDVSNLPSREMLDIEANVTVKVAKVKPALRTLHELASRVGGVVTEERFDSSSQAGAAQVTLRIPTAATQNVFAELDKLGNVLEQNVTARDIGKEYFDANLRLHSLEVTLHRYEEILTQAKNVDEILRIEQELGRIRAEIEQVKGNLRFLSDRAARATLHLALREEPVEIAHSDEPEAKFFPGLRLPALIDFGKRQTDTYVGGGVSIRTLGDLTLDLDLLKRTDGGRRGPDALVASLGWQGYSNLLGGGERRFLNPYLGWRAGYARFDRDSQAVLGVTLGLELFKNRWFGLDAEARNYLAVGGDRGGHYALLPALSARVAF